MIYKNIFRTIFQILKTPKINIKISGGSDAHKFFITATKSHPKYFLIKNKTVGVALLKIDPDRNILSGSEMQALRTNKNKAIKHGYLCKIEIINNDLIQEILEINTSIPFRQGKHLNESYTKFEDTKRYFNNEEKLFVVFSPNNKACAYLSPRFFGEICIISRLLGHNDHEKNGIMYLLVATFASWVQKERPHIKYIMYDTYFGASPGLKYFKERLGFKPYRVKWAWEKSNNQINQF